jgi:dTDP-4-amino-4,6-dideoxygalactose transaminase
MKVEFYRHSLNEDDIQAATKVLHSIFLTTGPAAKEFEQKFANHIGMAHVVALNSCTAALHLALLGLGIGPGDEVIVPAMTFIASATPVWHVGARPVLVDVEPHTGLLDLDKVEAAITPHTKAIIPVHLYGVMADMQALAALARKHGLFIVEDCAHCIEGVRNGTRPGQLADAACYSFYATKNLTCGEGGALATNNPDLAKTIYSLRQHGMNKEAAGRYTEAYQHWDMTDLGWKYNPSDILASLLISQIDRLTPQWQRRLHLFAEYDALLHDTPGLNIPARPGKSACHLYTVWVPGARRDRILRALQEKGIGVAVNYRAIHTLKYFREHLGHAPEDFPVALEIGQRTISLPLYPLLQEEEVAYVGHTLREMLGGISTDRGGDKG